MRNADAMLPIGDYGPASPVYRWHRDEKLKPTHALVPTTP